MKELIEIFELCLFTALNLVALTFGIIMVFSLIHAVWERL